MRYALHLKVRAPYGLRDMAADALGRTCLAPFGDALSWLLVSGDNRDQGDPDNLKFCGAGALSMDDRENYAVLMRVAMLSSLEAANTTGNLGFRCAKDLP